MGTTRLTCRAWNAALLAALLLASAATLAENEDFGVTEVAPGVFVHKGRIELMSGKNLGDIANIGFIIGGRCVAVIDTGGSPQVGAALRGSIAAHTDKPVCYVINTHAHPDHVLGDSAFIAQHPIFVAHKNFADALGMRMQTYLERFSRLYKQELAQDIIVPPDRTVTDHTSLDLGNRILKLTALPTGHTNSDLIVFDAQTATLWTGDFLFVRHIPVLDGSIKGWLTLIERLREIKAARAVPGHGPVSVSWPQALEAEDDYLTNIARGVRAAISRGDTIEEAMNTVGYAQRHRWQLFDEYHRRNVTAAYAELEWE